MISLINFSVRLFHTRSSTGWHYVYLYIHQYTVWMGMGDTFSLDRMTGWRAFQFKWLPALESCSCVDVHSWPWPRGRGVMSIKSPATFHRCNSIRSRQSVCLRKVYWAVKIHTKQNSSRVSSAVGSRRATSAFWCTSEVLFTVFIEHVLPSMLDWKKQWLHAYQS